MGIEILHVADAVAREKSVDRELVLEALEQALKTAARRTYGDKIVEARIQRVNGDIQLSHVRKVVEEVVDATNELTLEEAKAIDANAEIESLIKSPLPPIELGRIAAQTAKQVINQKIREAERERVVAEYEHRVGEIITGIVKRVERGNVYVDLGHGEAVMYREDQLPRESYRQGDRVRAYLREVRNQPKGPLLFLSRSDAGMVLKLFEQEVPEIEDGVVVIQGISRDPGSRSKIAVASTDYGVDPVGACVGSRGSRVQAIVNELHGEKIDIIEWTEDVATFIINALAPAEIERVVLDEASKTIEIAVNEENLAVAIGRRGQNVRLASELSGWNIELMTSGEEKQKRIEEADATIEIFKAILDIDEDFAAFLVGEGFLSLEDIAYSALEDMVAIEGLDEDVASELQNRARNALLDKALQASADEQAEPTLESLPGMTNDLVSQLEQFEVYTVEDLADAAADELAELQGVTSDEINALILAAREASGWFDD
ncbi:MAG: transcription termination/antitermination protein NusA [Zetaproteobacteria bacterium]|nr:transcription termination/antitermination protein NusA [Zetaproteobacteria bacterium]